MNVKRFFWVGVFLFFSLASRAQTFPDDFNDNFINPNHWGFDSEFGNGVLTEQNARVNYTVLSPAAASDSSTRPWIAELPMNASWEASLQVHNAHTPGPGVTDAWASIGFQLMRPGATFEIAFVELFAEATGSGANRGFLTSLEGDAIFGDEILDVQVTDAFIKMTYNAATKVLTTSYDQDGAGSAFTWQVLGSFGLGGSGGNLGNRDWGLKPTNSFTLAISGYSEHSSIGNGQIWADNFLLTIGSATLSDSYPDNFNDNAVDPAKWAADINDGSGRLFEQNQRVDYLVATPDPVYDFPVRPWTGPLPVDLNWEATVDVHNSFAATGTEWLSLGLQLVRPGAAQESIFLELISDASTAGTTRGFFTTLETNRQVFVDNFADVPVTDGSLRMSFASDSGILSLSYDRDGAGAAFGWELIGSYGLKGFGGSLATREWNLLPTQRFTLRLYAYSELATVSAGQAWLDNFRLNVASTAPLPKLTIVKENNTVRLRWPAVATGYTIQSITSLTQTNWAAITTPTTPTGTNFESVVTITPQNQFFRLIK